MSVTEAADKIAEETEMEHAVNNDGVNVEIILDHYQEICRQALVVQEHQLKEAKLSAQLKSAKKAREIEQQLLSELILEDIHQMKLPLKEDDSPSLADTSWRDHSIEELADKGVTAKKIESLQAAGISTLGDLQNLMQKTGEFWAADIKGVGGVAKTAIEDAMNAIVMEAENQPESSGADDDVIDPSFEIIPDAQEYVDVDEDDEDEDTEDENDEEEI